MATVNNITKPPVVTKPTPHKAMGKKHLPLERKRVALPARVLPSTKLYLESLGHRSVGRALDVLVKAMQHPGIRKMIEAKKDFKTISLGS